MKNELLLDSSCKYNFPDAHDFLKAAEIASEQINLLVTPKSEINRGYRNALTKEVLCDRYFPGFEMSDEQTRIVVSSNSIRNYIENGTGRTPVLWDRNVEYTQCTLPLTAEEANII